jgi:hypothetical protein
MGNIPMEEDFLLRIAGGKTMTKNVKRFPDCNCSEDYIQEQGTGKNYRNYNDLCTVNVIGVFQWRWPDGLAERLAPSLIFAPL